MELLNLKSSTQLILAIQEVQMRIITTQIDNPALKQMLKKEYGRLFRVGKALDKEWRNYVRYMKGFEDPEEAFDFTADYMYTVLHKFSQLHTSDSMDKLTQFMDLLIKQENEE